MLTWARAGALRIKPRCFPSVFRVELGSPWLGKPNGDTVGYVAVMRHIPRSGKVMPHDVKASVPIPCDGFDYGNVVRGGRRVRASGPGESICHGGR